MSKDKAAELTLGDIILQKIREKDAEVSTGVYGLFNCYYTSYRTWNCRVRSANCELLFSSFNCIFGMNRVKCIGKRHKQ